MPISIISLDLKNTNILELTLDEYLDLVDWTGRQIETDKPGAIPVYLSPILLRLDVDESRWLNTVRDFESMFHRAAGRMESIIAAARRIGLRWIGHGKRASEAARDKTIAGNLVKIASNGEDSITVDHILQYVCSTSYPML